MLRFAILRHDHPCLHWDLLLEQPTDALTWRLLDEPQPNVSLRAEQLPNHRRLYLDYEGPVSGNRGTVTRWDAGTLLVTLITPDHLVVQLLGAQFQGELQLTRVANTQWTAWLRPTNANAAN